MLQLPHILDKREQNQKTTVELYCTATCHFCRLVRKFFNERGIDYLEFRVDINTFSKLEMKQRSQRVTVPQIFINGYHVGGYDELIELDRNKQLEKLL